MEALRHANQRCDLGARLPLMHTMWGLHTINQGKRIKCLLRRSRHNDIYLGKTK